MLNGRPTQTVWISPVRSERRSEKSSFMNSSFGRSLSRKPVDLAGLEEVEPGTARRYRRASSSELLLVAEDLAVERAHNACVDAGERRSPNDARLARRMCPRARSASSTRRSVHTSCSIPGAAGPHSGRS